MRNADQLRWLAFEPETVQAMTAAFDQVAAALHVADKADPFRYVIAKKIIEIARKGERQAERLRDRALKDLRG